MPCLICSTPAFDKNMFPNSDDICGICGWYDDSCQYSDPNLEGSCNVVSLNQAKENYQYYGTTDLTRLDRIRKSIILGLVYGLKLEEKKSSADRIEKNKSLWHHLRHELIFEFFYPRFSYDNMDKVKTRIGKFYDEEEAISLNRFAIDFREFLERVGFEKANEVYTSDEEWHGLQKQALELVELMHDA